MTAELGRRIGFTLGALLVYRLGVHIPLPGLDPAALLPLYRGPSHDIHRLSILSIDILPYVSAAIIVQLVSSATPWLKRLKQRDQHGLQASNRYTISLMLVLVAFQAFGIALGLEDVADLVADPGWLFRISTMLTLAGGMLFLVWLSQQITVRGIGNGIALILLTHIVIELPGRIAYTLELGPSGLLSSNFIVVLAVLALAVTGAIVFMERAQRSVPVLFSPRQVGTRMVRETLSPIPFKLNGAGIIPV